MLAEVATVVIMATQCAVVDPIGNDIQLTTQHPHYTETRLVHYFDNGSITYDTRVPAFVRELVEEYRGTTLRVACK